MHALIGEKMVEILLKKMFQAIKIFSM